MNSIISAAKPVFIELVKDMGFTAKSTMSGVSFYRLMDGFVQSFKLYARNGHCSIRFFMSPLCAINDLTSEGNDISKFWTNSTEFIYVSDLMGGIEMPPELCSNEDKCDDTPVMQVKTPSEAVDKMILLFNKYLIPWFSNALTLETAYKAAFEFRYNQSINRRLRYQGNVDDEERREAYEETEKLYASTWFHWAMQMENVEKSLYYANLILSLADAEINTSPAESDMEYLHNHISHWKEIRDKISTNGAEYLRKTISDNTAKTLKNLKLTRTKIWSGDVK